MKSSPFQRFGVAAFRALAAARRGVDFADRVVSAAVTESMSDDERQGLSLAAYRATWHPSPAGLFEWERRWFDARFPVPGMRVLVAGAGDGREVRALEERGHDVVAFDPVEAAVAHARTRGADPATFVVADFDAFIRAVLEGPSTTESAVFSGPYDAVLLGWGSLTHVFGLTRREELLRAINLVCPDGPVLASFWMARGEAPRAVDLGRRVGARVRALRGLPPGDLLHVVPHAGPGHRFMREEIEGLADDAERTVVWDGDGSTPGSYAHVTLVPAGD